MSSETAKKPGVKKPQDHKLSAEEALDQRINSEDLLEGMPTLKAPTKLRLKQRNRLTILMLDSGLLDRGDDEADDEADEDRDLDLMDPAQRAKLKDMLGLAAEVDEFAESIAADPVAYAKWAEGKDPDTFLAILNLYYNAAGESDSSAS